MRINLNAGGNAAVIANRQSTRAIQNYKRTYPCARSYFHIPKYMDGIIYGGSFTKAQESRSLPPVEQKVGKGQRTIKLFNECPAESKLQFLQLLKYGAKFLLIGQYLISVQL